MGYPAVLAGMTSMASSIAVSTLLVLLWILYILGLVLTFVAVKKERRILLSVGTSLQVSFLRSLVLAPKS